MGQRVTGHGSSGSTNLSGSRGSRVKKCDPLPSLVRRYGPLLKMERDRALCLWPQLQATLKRPNQSRWHLDVDSGEPKEPVIRCGSRSPRENDNFGGHLSAHCDRQYPGWAKVVRYAAAAMRPFATSTVATCCLLVYWMQTNGVYCFALRCACIPMSGTHKTCMKASATHNYAIYASWSPPVPAGPSAVSA